MVKPNGQLDSPSSLHEAGDHQRHSLVHARLWLRKVYDSFTTATVEQQNFCNGSASYGTAMQPVGKVLLLLIRAFGHQRGLQSMEACEF